MSTKAAKTNRPVLLAKHRALEVLLNKVRKNVVKASDTEETESGDVDSEEVW